jgi:hypothetical protein
VLFNVDTTLIFGDDWFNELDIKWMSDS